MTKLNKLTPQFITTRVGYVLFILLALGVVLGTVYPYVTILLQPYPVRYANVIGFMLSFVAGAILPALIAYFIGDASVRSRSRQQHHFNGVVFGLLSYWITALLGLNMGSWVQSILGYDASFSATQVAVVNALIIIGSVFVSSVIAVAHTHSKVAKKDVIEYLPFQVVAIGAPLLITLISIISSLSSGFEPGNQGALFSIFFSLGLILVPAAAVWVSLRKAGLTKSVRLTWVALLVSVLFIATYVLFEVVYGIVAYLIEPHLSGEVRLYLDSHNLEYYVGFIIALVLWVVYWRKIVKSFTNGKTKASKKK